MFKLEQFGLGRKKKGYFQSKSKSDQNVGLKGNPYLKGFIIVVFLGLLIGFFPGRSFQDLAYKLGEPWRDDDLTAPFTFSLLKDREELRQAQEEARLNTPAVFYTENAAMDQVEDAIDDVFDELSNALETFGVWRQSVRNNAESREADSLAFYRALGNTDTRFDADVLDALLQNFAQTTGGGQQARSRFIGIDLRLQVTRTIRELYSDGVIDIPKSDITTQQIVLRDPRDRTQQTLIISAIRDLNEASDFARFRLNRTFSGINATAALQLYEMVMRPNFIFNENDTQEAIQEAIDAISPTRGAVTEGQMIIRKGDLITAERLNMLQSLEAARATRASDLEIWQQHTGNAIVIIAIFLFFMMYLYLYRRPIYDNNAMLSLVLLAMGIVLAFAIFVIRVENLSIYLVPMAIAPIILTIIFDSRVGLMTTTVLALMIAFMSGNNFEYVVAAVTAGGIAVYSVRDIKNRSQFFLTTPGLVLLAFAMVLFGFTLIRPGGWSGFTSQTVFIFGNAVLIWLTYPLILLFEKIFRVTTEVSLLELNNNNHPLLRSLMTRAPGTFQHSLQVANLAEAAATAINANSLLCRVGALYHDIGKMDKPEYFVENQFGENEHDKLKPRMSAMVIKNHVSTGVKMAEEAGLPEVIIDFIKTHHGDSIIRYFYEKAKNEVEKGSEVREEDFKYNGPLPNSKETGILLLADCVEASSRAMNEPSYQKLENLVNRMIDERLEEGQLNDCDITLRDLRIIKESFLGILVGMYHSRVKYPGQAEKDGEAQVKGQSEVHDPSASTGSAQFPSGSD